VAYICCLTRILGGADQYSQPRSPPDDDLVDFDAALNSRVIVVQSQLNPASQTAGQCRVCCLVTNIVKMSAERQKWNEMKAGARSFHLCSFPFVSFYFSLFHFL